MINLLEINGYKENNRIEAKKATGGFPQSLWATYSSFANTDGGIILLGVIEKDDKTLQVIGLDEPDKLISDFWNMINNPQKVSINVLSDRNVQVHDDSDKKYISIEVPRVDRELRPIYLNEKPYNETYRRNGEGDYHCSAEEIDAMFRDRSVKTQDMLVLEKMDNSVFNYDTVKTYRNRLLLTRPDHVWERLPDDEFLQKLGAIGFGDNKEQQPTAAGLLMFGNDYDIVNEYGNYFLDYQEQLDVDIRWTDRVNTSTGQWSGNVCDFYFKVMNKIAQTLKVPFKLNGDTRIEDTPVHEAVREALVNCLVNADYYGRCGVVIKRKISEITFENPGGFRVPIELAKSGGVSDPRNSVLMKMFNLLNIGDRAGTGVPNIIRVWEDEGFGEPQYEEIMNYSRTKLTLPLAFTSDKQAIKRKQAIKASDKTKTSDKQAIKVSDKTQLILSYFKVGNEYKSTEIASYIGLSTDRTRVYLKEMVDVGKIKSKGANKSKVYYLPE